MINYLFSKLPSIIFEPFAGGVLLGFVTVLITNRKKRSIFFWPILCSILFMLIWRIGCCSLMLSSRYSAILIYPAVILTVICCFHLESHWKRFLRSFGTGKPVGDCRFFQHIFCFLIAGFAILCLDKDLHFNSYAWGPQIISQHFLDDSNGSKDVYAYFVNCKEINRLFYYTKLSPKQVSILRDEDLSNPKVLENALLMERNNYKRFYIFVTQNAQDKGYFPREKVLANGKMSELIKCWTSRKKKKELILYRYEPLCRNIEEWHEEIPPISPQSICRNGDFEETLTGKGLENRIAYYKELGASDFYLSHERLFPQEWWLGVSKNLPDAPSPEMALTADHPISGMYSLEIRNTRSEASGLNSGTIPVQDCIFSGFIRGKISCSVWIDVRGTIPDTNQTDVLDSIRFEVLPEKTYRFSVPLLEKDIPSSAQSIHLIIRTDGHILLDQVECIPNQAIDTSKIDKI